MEKMTKAKFLSTIAERTGVTKKDAGAMWDVVCDITAKQLKGAGVMVLPGLVRMSVKDIPGNTRSLARTTSFKPSRRPSG
jgi:nucleoid DNA-binding protein